MNTLILNRESFKTPDDGWYQLAPLGEFPHAAAGVVQVVDAEACTAMAARFKADAAVANFAGLLVDFDHFSLDDRARSEAAGWIVEMECRLPNGGRSGFHHEGHEGARRWSGPRSRAQRTLRGRAVGQYSVVGCGRRGREGRSVPFPVAGLGAE